MRIDQRYRFIINNDPQHLEVHDMDNERTGCQIREIKRYNFLISTSIGALEAWLKENPQYDGCMYCLPAYHRK